MDFWVTSLDSLTRFKPGTLCSNAGCVSLFTSVYSARLTVVAYRQALAAITMIYSGNFHSIHEQLPKTPCFSVFAVPSSDITKTKNVGSIRA